MSDLVRLLEPRLEEILGQWTEALAPAPTEGLREQLAPVLGDLLTALRRGSVEPLRAARPDLRPLPGAGSPARGLELLTGLVLDRAAQAGVGLTAADARVLTRFVVLGAGAAAERPAPGADDARREALLAQSQQARKEANRERRKQHELFMQTPIAIAIVEGPEHVCVFANTFYLDMARHRDVVGKRLLDAMPELRDLGFDGLLDRALATGEVFHGKEVPVSIHHHLGTDHYVLNFVHTPTRNHRGEVEGVMMCGWDVTEQVKARRQAEEATRLRDEFLDTINHELRPPLTAMLGWVQMLRDSTLPPEQRDRALETIERNARAQAQLVDDLLDMGRILSSRLRLEVGPLDVAAVAGAAIETVRPAAEARGIRLQEALEPGAVVMGDPDRLQQVLWNLLMNAIRYTPRRGRVRVSVSRQGSWVEVVVSDTGQGIAPSFLPHVFERFRQTDDAITRAQGGLGLGLSIVQPLVELHGGAVSVASEGLGRGTTFTVRLPLADAPARESGAPPPAAAAPEALPLANLSLLVVDDDDDTREMIGLQLEARGARVRQGDSAAEGMRLLTAERPDLLLSDIGMPGTSGYDFIASIRALPPERGGDVPAVALTAYARSEDRTQALAAGFDAHLTKPVDPRELIATIAALARPADGAPRAT